MICEGCIKQSTCKYKEVVEEYEADAPEMLFDEPLEATVICKYKQNGGYNPYVYPGGASWSDNVLHGPITFPAPVLPDSGATTDAPAPFTHIS